MKKAFTLIELMISIMILSILMIFLYKSYSSLNISNKKYSNEVQKIKNIELIKKTIYLDFTLSAFKSIKILNQSKTEDVIFMQSSNSIHDRINPYIAYLVKAKKLYRLESLKPFKFYPLSVDSEFETDFLGKVKNFRVYQNDKNSTSSKYLVDIDFEKMSDVLLKIKPLNSK